MPSRRLSRERSGGSNGGLKNSGSFRPNRPTSCVYRYAYSVLFILCSFSPFLWQSPVPVPCRRHPAPVLVCVMGFKEIMELPGNKVCVDCDAKSKCLRKPGWCVDRCRSAKSPSTMGHPHLGEGLSSETTRRDTTKRRTAREDRRAREEGRKRRSDKQTGTIFDRETGARGGPCSSRLLGGRTLYGNNTFHVHTAH